MNPAPADSVPKPPGDVWLDEPKPPRAGWLPAKLMLFIVLVLAAHLGFIFVFGTKKPIVPRAVSRVPQLRLAESASELIALDDPTLFALPHANDYATAFWQRPPAITAPSFRWTAPTNWLLPEARDLGACFREFILTNAPAKFALNFKPPPFTVLSTPAIAVRPQNSTLQITGDLARRRLLKPIKLPALAHNDVLPPGKVQALVDAGGNVLSVVLLEASGLELADTNALAIARSARFAPAAQLGLGELIFNWRTIPQAATNSTAIP